MNRPKLFFILRLTVGSALFLALSMRADWQDALELIRRLNLWYVLLAGLLFPLGIVLSAYKWQILLNSQGIRIPLCRLVSNYWIGFFANNFFVSSIGGDIARVALLRSQGGADRVAASVLMERLTGLVILLFWSVFALLLLSDRLSFPVFGVLAAAAVAGILLVGLLFSTAEWSVAWLERWSVRIPEGRLFKGAEFFLKLSKATAMYRHQYPVVLQALCLSLLFYITPWLLQYLLVRGSGLEVSSLDIFTFVPLINLLGTLPLTPNAIGITESAFVFFYGLSGVSAGEAMALALCVRFLGVSVSVIGGALWMAGKGKGLDAQI